MSPSESARGAAARYRHRVLAAAAAAIVLAAGAVAAVAATHSGTARPAGRPARLTASSCSGPAGAAYIADAGWDGFTAINTANCDIIQTYNVGDSEVPGDAGDQNYSSTDEAVAMSGSTLYFADTGDDSVGVIDAAALNPSNYNPAETDIHVGFDPEDLALTPDGSQLWVANTGPQTQPDSPASISIISTATNTVTRTLRLPGAPAQIAFSPSGGTAYVTTSAGLVQLSTATGQVTGFIRGLGDPHGIAVAPGGGTVYVTNTIQGQVEVISTAADRVTATIGVGQLPWQVVLSASGRTLYVADADSNEVSVIGTAIGKVTGTWSVSGGPDTLALTPDGSQLWVGGITSAIVTVIDTASGAQTGSINLGGDGANSGDGYEPTGIVLTSTPAPGS